MEKSEKGDGEIEVKCGRIQGKERTELRQSVEEIEGKLGRN